MEGATSTVTLTILRAAGTFTEVTVDWEVTASSAGSDISPTSGRVTFSKGQTTGTFTISALEDEVCAIMVKKNMICSSYTCIMLSARHKEV